jgi:hypothetical protein
LIATKSAFPTCPTPSIYNCAAKSGVGAATAEEAVEMANGDRALMD